jgi:hypothetical protein
MSRNDIKLNEDSDWVFSYGGGCIILTCKKCKKDVGAEEVSFPGTKEQQAEPRSKLEQKKHEHKCNPINSL